MNPETPPPTPTDETQPDVALRIEGAPPPTCSDSTGRARLNPVFVEWLMGLPAGWVHPELIPPAR